MTLKEIREKKGLTRQKVAAVLGVTSQCVCMWEMGKRKLKFKHLVELAKLYKVSITALANIINEKAADNEN